MSIVDSPTFLFEEVLKRRNFFFISNKTLHEIEYGMLIYGIVHAPMKNQFNQLLEKENLILKHIDDELSLIKKM